MAIMRGDVLEYVHMMPQELFDCLAEAKALNDLRMVRHKALGIRKRYLDGQRHRLFGRTRGEGSHWFLAWRLATL